ncbi:MAG: uroporphyrinogen-III C-methyltransferase [Holophaga sp.]|nr:uroporphyrinogen-III C-methyltransferase [Holophaga sp.]
MNQIPAWLPLQLRLQGRLAVLVGAGAVARRKAEKLAQAGARLRIIAPPAREGADPDLPAIERVERIERIVRAYSGPGDLQGAFLVVAATGDPALNARIARDARGMGALVLRADAPEDSDVHFPATLRQGALTVSFATGGICPAYAARLKEEAAPRYGPEHARRLETIRNAKQSPAFRSLPAGERRARLTSWASDDPEFRPGSVAMVGAGPGDLGLLTLKAVAHLRAADVVVYDALANREILDRFAPTARHIDAGKHKGGCVLTQDRINALLADLAGQGLRVLRLKGGDPCLFGRAGEEARALAQAGIPFVIVPGVSSLSAVPATAGIPVTDRDFGRSLGAFSLHKRNGQPPAPEEWERMARGPETLVLFMGRSRVREACRQLILHGRGADLPAALIVNGTLPGQRTVTGTLATLPDRVEALEVQGPGLIVVGEVVRLAGLLNPHAQEAPCPA